MKNFPKISIVTPCLNSAKYIEQTIISITSQQYPNLEYIVIDGGSTDGTVDIIKKHAHMITYWESEPDSGQYYALQRGFDKSSGEIMAWLNADDMLHHGSLFAVAEIFSTIPNVKWIMGQPTMFNHYGSCVKVYAPNEVWHRLRILEDQERFLQQESTFWKRELWEQAGAYIDTSQKLAGDFELWARFFRYVDLHTVTAIFGGFRFSSAEQRSVSQYSEYLEEISKVREREFKRMPTTYIRLFTRFRNNLAAWIRRHPMKETFLLRNLYYAVYGPAPNIISFDFATWNYRLITDRFSKEEQGTIARSTLMDKA
jgi:glycosyltransferase involved in cell wall biosynthesis